MIDEHQTGPDAAGPVGKVAVLTGASSGIGAAAALALHRLGWTLALVGRDPHRLAQLQQRLTSSAAGPVWARCCDFADLGEVRALADALLSAFARIDVLANNAGGTSGFRGARTTVDGFDVTLQVNHLAGFLLACRLREALRGGRIITTASLAHMIGSLDPATLSSRLKLLPAIAAYGSAKQANILFAAEAARRWPDILSTSFHPGIVRTRFGRESVLISLLYRVNPLLRSPEQGAQTLVWLATADRTKIIPGAYYSDLRPRQPAANAVDAALAAQLWQASLAATTG